MNDSLIIDDDRVVVLHYQLNNGFGEIIDSSSGDLPLVYMHNTRALLPTLERELTGRRAGEGVDVTIFPEDAYGYIDDALVQSFSRESLADIDDLTVGMRVRARDKEGESQLATVREITDDGVVLDANHPLAGQVLHFTIAIVAVREPTDAERERGYATTANPEN